MFRVGAIKFQLCLEGNAESKASFNTLFNCVSGRIDIIIEEFEYEIVSCICNWKIFRKDFKKSFFLSVFGGCPKLEKLTE